MLGLVPALCTLVVVIVASVTVTSFTARRNTTRDIDAQAAIVGESISAALAFRDEDSARTTLRQLEARPNIDAVCVFDAGGGLFASYVLPGRTCGSTLAENGLTAKEVVVARPVNAGGRQLGTVVIAGNLSLFYQWIRIQAFIFIGALIAGTALALALTQLMQRAISKPVLDLATTADHLTTRRDYSLRAMKTTDDEVGRLAQSFNAMLDEIEHQNDALTVEIAERKRAEYLKDQFLAAVSHELRTPLNAILGWLQILKTTEGGPERLARALESIERNARSQTRVIEDLLDVSRMTTGKLQVRMSVVDLCAIVTSAIESARPMITAKFIHLELDVPQEPCLISGDGDRLQQVASNLLSNAVKFTPADGSVTVALSTVGPDYVLSVSDTGVGISREFLPFVFDRFRQADGSMTRQYGGLGLGLAIVKEVTALHNGTVTAKSPGEGHGSTFTVRLPQLMVASQPAPFGPATTLRAGAQPLSGIRILVVDDDVDGLEIVKTVLSASGADVRTVPSGREAIAAWTDRPSDALLCDLAMPDMDGFQVLSLVRDLDAGSGHRTAAIALTAFATDEYRERCRSAGFDAQVGKPFDTYELTVAILATLARVQPGRSQALVGRPVNEEAL